MKLKEIVLHFRQYRAHGERKVLKNNGGYTILIAPEFDPKNNTSGYRFIYSRCGKRDNFSKGVGVSIVRGRLAYTMLTTAPLPAEVYNKNGKLLSQRMPKIPLLNKLLHMNDVCRAGFTKEFFETLIERMD